MQPWRATKRFLLRSFDFTALFREAIISPTKLRENNKAILLCYDIFVRRMWVSPPIDVTSKLCGSINIFRPWRRTRRSMTMSLMLFISMKGVLEKDVQYRAILSVIHDRKSG